MEIIDSIYEHDRQAEEYDKHVLEWKWYGHDILFGMCFEFVSPNQRLLDIGIGTGLSSTLFAKAGLEVYGIDGSSEMLRVCESKGFAKEFKQFDLRELPLPYPDAFFDHVICSGVVHFLSDLRELFREINRVVKIRGIFAFNILPQIMETEDDSHEGDFMEVSIDGVSIFMHNEVYIEKLLKECGYVLLKEMRFTTRSWLEEGSDSIVKVCVVQRNR
ncbi:MAG: class I SAM-dependent methyltransferase [Phycisphaerae bacterium]|nr:class I SAM-dependent methyltransferase [Phycisphaerae bacterium]